jgi:putative peptide zinc metalloprotease protein
MLCPQCHRHLDRTTQFCGSCGATPATASATYDLVLPDRARVPLVGRTSIGRDPANDVRLADPSVSRSHAVIVVPAPGWAPVVQDAGSSHGVWLDGLRLDGGAVLRDGARVTIGDQELRVERRRDDDEAGHTVIVPGEGTLAPGPEGSGDRPRLRSGYALKRLDSTEGASRWVLKDLVGQQLLRLGDADAGLLQLVDGERSLADLVAESERALGPPGPARLARVLADIGSRGLLTGTAPPEKGPTTGIGSLLRERRATWSGAGALFDRVYRNGGWMLFTRPVLAAMSLVAVLGAAAFGYLVATRSGTPFSVAHSIGIGGAVFVVGRLAVAMLHESAHGLTLASYGRRVGAAGAKLILVFPYVFVDTSDAWFEPRRHRMAVSAAGPLSDLVVGGTCALGCLALSAGVGRDILFQLAFGAYLGALFNLNPLLDRDGYQVLVDALGRPGLRRRALEQLRRRLAGRQEASDSRMLHRYALCTLAWMLLTAAGGAAMLSRYERRLALVLPEPAVLILVGCVVLGLLVPPLLLLYPALRERLRERSA